LFLVFSSYDLRDHKRESGVFFHTQAIGASNGDKIYHRGKRDYIYKKKYDSKILEKLRLVKIRTLRSTMKLLKHQQPLDVFRINAEGPRVSYEFNILQNLLNDQMFQCIQQISLNFHFFGSLLFSSDEKDEAISSKKATENALFAYERITLLKKLNQEFNVHITSSNIYDSNGTRVTGASEFIELLRSKKEHVTFVILLYNQNQVKSCFL